MLGSALMLALAVTAFGAARRPATVALSCEGASETKDLADFLKFRLKETFDVDAVPSPPETAGDGDFFVHVVALPNDVFSVRVEEAGTTIAARDIIAPRDPSTEVWFFTKTTLRRALFATSLAPGGPRLDAAPNATLPINFNGPIDDLGGSELAIRALGGLEMGAAALFKGGMIGADYRIDSFTFGGEVGYHVSSPGGQIDVRRIPISATAGMRLWDAVPLVLGVFAGVDNVRADASLTSASAWVSSFGPFARGRAELLDRLALVFDVHARFTLPRVRYLLPDERTEILESAVSVSVATGVEWRWR